LGCKSSTEPVKNDPSLKDEYVSLNIGNVMQYHLVGKDTYILMQTYGMKNRKDGKAVYAIRQIIQLPTEEWAGETYHYIKDGYYMRTELDTVNDGQYRQINPFNETKLFPIYPKAGNEFSVNDYTSYPDKYQIKIDFADTLKTPMRTFYNVAVSRQYKNGVEDRTLYYAKGIGLIGTSYMLNGEKINYFINYMKLADYEEGQFINKTYK
jgi:hypothetical protein